MANPNPSPSTRFGPGNNANPGGRPAGRSLTAILREQIDRAEGDGTVAEALVGALIREAMAGDRQAIRDIFERVDGKVPDRQEHDGKVVVEVRYADGRTGLTPAAPGTEGNP